VFWRTVYFSKRCVSKILRTRFIRLWITRGFWSAEEPSAELFLLGSGFRELGKCRQRLEYAAVPTPNPLIIPHTHGRSAGLRRRWFPRYVQRALGSGEEAGEEIVLFGIALFARDLRAEEKGGLGWLGRGLGCEKRGAELGSRSEAWTSTPGIDL